MNFQTNNIIFIRFVGVGKTAIKKMSNKKFSKRIVKNQSMNMNYPTSKSWRNSDGSYTLAIPVPMFMINETYMYLFLHMAAYIAEYMKRENIKTVNQWDKFADNADFRNKTVNRIINDYGKTCCKHLNIDMIEHAPIFLNSVEELMNLKRSWCDDIVTPRTNFKYEWLPILHAAATLINNHVNEFAQEYIDGYNKLMNEQKVA